MVTSQDITQYQAPADLLKDCNIVVTGAGDGIGRAVALAFAAHGATVILLGRTQSKLENVYDEIEARGYPTAAIYPINLEGAIEHDFTMMAETLEKEFSQLHGILHNASELGPRTPIGNYSVEAWQKVLQVNITAPFMMTKALLPLLQKADNASIVFTGSSVGIKGRAYWGAYAVSKAATENLMQVLADELESGGRVRVNSINPGATRTKMRATAYPAENPAGVTAPEELVNRYLFLMGRESESISGQQFDAQPK